MDLLAKLSSPAVQQKYINKIRRQILSQIGQKGYDDKTQPRCGPLDDILNSTVGTSINISQACCALLEDLVRDGYVDAKFAAHQLQTALFCALDSTSSVVLHTASALSVLPFVAPINSFSHPLLLLLNEYPSLWPQLLSMLEAALGKSPASSRPRPRAVSSEEYKFLILHTLLRPEWPLEHSQLRLRTNTLLLNNYDTNRNLIHNYTLWLPTPSNHLLEVAELLVDNLSRARTFEGLIILLVFVNDVASKNLDFSFVLHGAISIAKQLEESQSHCALTLLLSSLFTSCSRFYCEILLDLLETLMERNLLPFIHHLRISILHSAVADDARARELLAVVVSQPKKSVHPLPNIYLPANLLIEAYVASTHMKPGPLPCGIPCNMKAILLAGKLVSCSSEDLPGWLEQMKLLTQQDSDSSCVAFHALMIRIDEEPRPKLLHLLLNTLPQIATSKISATFARNALITLLGKPSLYCVALRILTDLYVRYDTLCFPVLLKAINSVGNPQAAWATAMTKAVCMNIVIQHSPHLHGRDLIAPLSRLLSNTSNEASSVLLSAFESIQFLIAEGILDFSSFVKKFAAFETDPRFLVRSGFARLLGLVSQTNGVPSKEMLRYQRKLLATLLSENEDPVVKAGCLEALACFRSIPVQSLPAEAASKFSVDSTDDSGINDSVIPISFFLDLSREYLESSTMKKAFRNFAMTRLDDEVPRLPRHVIVHKEVRARRDVEDSTLAQIPRLQQSFFHQATDIKPQVAAGLLLTYNPPVKTDQLGRPTKISLVQHSNSFRVMLRSLLEHAPLLNEEDWLMSLNAMQQWHLLIKRGFESLTNGRKAERESNDAALVDASLWARDELCEILADVDSSNCVIALCSLVAVIAEFDQGLNFKERLIMDQNKNYINHSSWHRRALTSLLKLLKGLPIDDAFFARLLGNFTRSSAATDKAVSALLFSCHHLMPLLQTRNLLDEVLSYYTMRVSPGQEFMVTVGAGLMIEKLAVKGLVELGENIHLKCNAVLSHYEEKAFVDGKVASSWYLIGLTLALCGLCSLKSFSVATQSFCAKLIRLLRETVPHDETFDKIAVCGSLIVANACNYVLSEKSLEDLAAWLTQNRAEFQQNEGIAVALGVTLHAMAIQEEIRQSPEKKGQKLVEALVTKIWLPVVANAQEAAANKRAAVKGIATLTEALNHLFVQYRDVSWDCNSVLSRDVTSSLLESMIRDLNSTSQDLALKGHHIWTLGLFHQTLSRTFKQGTVFPKTVELNNFLLGEIMNNSAKDSLIYEIYSALGRRFNCSLPCFSWISFEPLLKTPACLDIVRLCMYNCESTPSLVPLLEKALNGTLLLRYEDPVKQFLMDHVCTVVEFCDVAKVGALLTMFRDKRLLNDDLDVSENAWKMLVDYMEKPSSKPASISLLLELVCFAVPLTKSRYFTASCLVKLKDPMFRDAILRNLKSKSNLRKALELRMKLCGALEINATENPFDEVELMGETPFREFVSECTAVNCYAAPIDNSAKWLLEIVPKTTISLQGIALLSLISMMTSGEGVVTGFSESDLITVLPYQIEQLINSKVWGHTAVEKLLEWIISILENTSASSDVYRALYGTLLTLRHCQAFKSGRLWTRAVLLRMPST